MVTREMKKCMFKSEDASKIQKKQAREFEYPLVLIARHIVLLLSKKQN